MNTSNPATPSTLTVFMLVKSLPAWLELPPDARRDALREHVMPLLERHREHVRLRLFDVEFYAARITDVWMWEATSHQAYERLIEALRDTPFWDRYFSIVEILPGVEHDHVGEHAAETPAA
ncbi:darcynin family protein [Paraburkholderia sp. J67]|uniref:darcynin family protein n=1 Tax=Paraburkholderia sp. J67 TaxID=2805435 RepID=UPI002ABE1B6C|nr:darcynin family protein [Paraburkholderia sp. J67]